MNNFQVAMVKAKLVDKDKVVKFVQKKEKLEREEEKLSRKREKVNRGLNKDREQSKSEEIKWVQCPLCKSKKVHAMSSNRYICKECNFDFTKKDS